MDKDLLESMAIRCILTAGTSKATGVAGRSKDVPYWQKLLWENYLNCILRFPLLFKTELQVFKKVSFEPNSVAVSLSLLKREAILHLKLESPLDMGHRIFGAFPILCIAGLENIYLSKHFLNQ